MIGRKKKENEYGVLRVAGAARAGTEEIRQLRTSERREGLACDIGSYASDSGSGMMFASTAKDMNRIKISLDFIQIEVVLLMLVMFLLWT